jgi:hypothetical protein
VIVSLQLQSWLRRAQPATYLTVLGTGFLRIMHSRMMEASASHRKAIRCNKGAKTLIQRIIQEIVCWSGMITGERLVELLCTDYRQPERGETHLHAIVSARMTLIKALAGIPHDLA